MFGQLRPVHRCMSVNDRNDYHGEYCNLCGSISRTYGFSSRTLVLYDFASLAWLILDRLSPTQAHRRLNCIRGSRSSRSELSAIDQFLAALSVYACAVKIHDDLTDERRLRSRISARFYESTFRQAEADLLESRFPLEQLREILSAQTDLERAGETQLDLASSPTGKAYELIARHLVLLEGMKTDEATAGMLGEISGRCIFLADAYRDYPRDVGRSYNPLVVDPSQTFLSEERHQTLAEYVTDLFRRVETTLSFNEPKRMQRWHWLRERLRSLMGFERTSVTLNATCCIPCGDGAIAVDDEDCSKCCNSLGLCCCLCICACVNR